MIYIGRRIATPAAVKRLKACQSSFLTPRTPASTQLLRNFADLQTFRGRSWNYRVRFCSLNGAFALPGQNPDAATNDANLDDVLLALSRESATACTAAFSQLERRSGDRACRRESRAG
jgi:hypothetical protein